MGADFVGDGVGSQDCDQFGSIRREACEWRSSTTLRDIPVMTETAYYYPAPYWAFRESDWVKSLLLFFDDIAILLPNYMYGRHTAADPTLAQPLEDRGLLRVLDPNDWVDQEVAGKLANTIIELLANGVFDDLPKTEYFAELSRSRIGYGADVKLAESVVAELQTRGLARPSEDGVSIPLHPDVRTTILVILAQFSRVAGRRRGMTIHPVTNCREAVGDLTATLSRESMPSRDRIITLDLEPVTFDLATIPLDEVLQFRAQYQDTHRAYMRDVRGFISELADIDSPDEREKALLKRRQDIADAAHDIQRSTRTAFGKNLASWSLGIVGAVWSASDPIGLALTAAGVITGLIPGSPNRVSAYSYLFSANDKFGRSTLW